VGGGDRDVLQHAEGPFLGCHGGGFLARRAASRVGIRRQHNTGVGGGDGDVLYHARKPFRVHFLYRFLARWRGTSHEPRRYSFASNPCCDIALEAAAAVLLHCSAGSVDIAQPATRSVASARVSTKVDCSTRRHSLSRACIWSCGSA
jgi:hypothetical protein